MRAKDIDVVILCGGKGERLKTIVRDRPKPMVEFNGEPFLTHLMVYAAKFGFRRFILSAGFRGRMIERYYRRHPAFGQVAFSREGRPLGTGGAVKHAASKVRSRTFLVLNGDSFLPVRLDKFLGFHAAKKALVSLVVVKSAGSRNSGKVFLDRGNRVVGFEEKALRKPRAFDSAGIYLMQRAVFSRMPKKKAFSLEYDLFPALARQRCFGFVERASLLDFGTPSGYRRARRRWTKGLK